ncbi:hypothetical protein N7530_006017 [Penicillium desertorum]|nr:hypothetical protein N7530_006017 [Penicillium desertorum]
MLTTIR